MRTHSCNLHILWVLKAHCFGGESVWSKSERRKWTKFLLTKAKAIGLLPLHQPLHLLPPSFLSPSQLLLFCTFCCVTFPCVRYIFKVTLWSQREDQSRRKEIPLVVSYVYHFPSYLTFLVPWKMIRRTQRMLLSNCKYSPWNTIFKLLSSAKICIKPHA